MWSSARSWCRPWSGTCARVGLVDGDGRRDALDTVRFGLVHAVQELPCIGEKVSSSGAGLRSRSCRRPATTCRPADAGDDDQLVQRQPEVKPFQVVLPCASMVMTSSAMRPSGSTAAYVTMTRDRRASKGWSAFVCIVGGRRSGQRRPYRAGRKQRLGSRRRRDEPCAGPGSRRVRSIFPRGGGCRGPGHEDWRSRRCWWLVADAFQVRATSTMSRARVTVEGSRAMNSASLHGDAVFRSSS